MEIRKPREQEVDFQFEAEEEKDESVRGRRILKEGRLALGDKIYGLGSTLEKR